METKNVLINWILNSPEPDEDEVTLEPKLCIKGRSEIKVPVDFEAPEEFARDYTEVYKDMHYCNPTKEMIENDYLCMVWENVFKRELSLVKDCFSCESPILKESISQILLDRFNVVARWFEHECHDEKDTYGEIRSFVIDSYKEEQIEELDDLKMCENYRLTTVRTKIWRYVGPEQEAEVFKSRKDDEQE